MGMIDSLPNIWCLVLAFCFLKILLTLSPRHHSLSGGFVFVCYWCFPVKYGEILECGEYISPRESQLRGLFTYRTNVWLYFLPPLFFFFWLLLSVTCGQLFFFYKIHFYTCKFHIHGFKELSAGISRKAVSALNRMASVLVACLVVNPA